MVNNYINYINKNWEKNAKTREKGEGKEKHFLNKTNGSFFWKKHLITGLSAVIDI